MKLPFCALVIILLIVHTAKSSSQNVKVSQENSKSNVFITPRNGPEATLRRLGRLTGSRGKKAAAVKKALVAHAARTQKAILRYLKDQNLAQVQVQSFYISNQIYVRGATPALIAEIRFKFHPISIDRERFESLISSRTDNEPRQSSTTYTWGVARIQAPEAWALDGGSNGVSAVVGGIDTGVRVTHVALRGNFIGAYGWYDPVEETKAPNDQNGHGTHTMGTMVGAGGIGVAPGAKWMACKGCEGDSCAQSDLLSCGQFMLCPTLPDKSQEDCSKAPDVINNSWGGLIQNSNYNSMIRSWRLAGIIPVFALGNSGPGCGTAGSPGSSLEVIAVGATTRDSQIADYSSRGPVRGSGIFREIKPDVAAPGSAVNSSWYTSDTAYNSISGTSMAAPHTAGVVALMIAVKNDLTYDQVKDNLLRGCTTAGLQRPLIPCEPVFRFPNNEYGQGLINARNSVRRIIG